MHFEIWLKVINPCMTGLGYVWKRNGCWCPTIRQAPGHQRHHSAETHAALELYYNTNVNTLRPRQNGRYFAEDIFKFIFLNENAWISIKISLKFVCIVPINNILALVQIMAWRRQGDSQYLNEWWLVYWRIYESFGLNEISRLWAAESLSVSV